MYGGYGEVVITLVCGTGVMGSIPVSRPIEKLVTFISFSMGETIKEKRPICISFAAPVGTSKTPIATYLSWNTGLPIFSNDAIRSEVHQDTSSGNLDQEIYLERRDERLTKVISSKKVLFLMRVLTEAGRN